MASRGRIIYSEETRFGQIQIMDTTIHGQPVRYYLVDGWQESAMYLDPELRDRLIFPYMQELAWPLSMRPLAKSIFLIGGGCLVWPRHVLMNYDGMSVTAAELYPETVRIASDFFYADELKEQYSSRFRMVTGDGFEMLRESGLRCDFIVNDAFVGRKRMGRSMDDSVLVHDHLTKGGIYAVNVTSAVKGPGSLHLNLFLTTLGRVFRNTDYLVCEPERSPMESQNILVIASDGPLQ